jgi:hypothetical protein
MTQRTLFRIGTALMIAVAGIGCSTPSYTAKPRPYVPRVQLPEYQDLNENERLYLAEVQDALGDAGYRSVHGPAEFRLGFYVEDGPINAETKLSLFRSDVLMTESKARVGGPRIIFKRSTVVRESFQKCLADFETKLPRMSMSGGMAAQDGWAAAPMPAPASTTASKRQEPTPAPYAGGYSTYNDDGAYGQPGGVAPDWQSGW